MQKMNATVIDIRKIGADKAAIRLRPDSSLNHKAGQYIELTFAGIPPRYYSVASMPGDDFIEIHIKDNAKGGAASYAVQSLTPGEIVTVRGPLGTGIRPPGSDRPILMIAGGMGIVPLKVLAQEVLTTGHKAPVTLIWGARSEGEFYLRDDLEQMKKSHAELNVFYVCEHPVSEAFSMRKNDLHGTDIFLAGPPDMIRVLVPEILARGADASAIHSDHEELLQSLLSAQAQIS